MFSNSSFCRVFFFFFNDTATTEIYTLSLHDALPIFQVWFNLAWFGYGAVQRYPRLAALRAKNRGFSERSEEHTSELQSQFHLVCRLLLEKKKKKKNQKNINKERHKIDTSRGDLGPAA